MSPAPTPKANRWTSPFGSPTSTARSRATGWSFMSMFRCPSISTPANPTCRRNREQRTGFGRWLAQFIGGESVLVWDQSVAACRPAVGTTRFHVLTWAIRGTTLAPSIQTGGHHGGCANSGDGSGVSGRPRGIPGWLGDPDGHPQPAGESRHRGRHRGGVLRHRRRAERAGTGTRRRVVFVRQRRQRLPAESLDGDWPGTRLSRRLGAADRPLHRRGNEALYALRRTPAVGAERSGIRQAGRVLFQDRKSVV